MYVSNKPQICCNLPFFVVLQIYVSVRPHLKANYVTMPREGCPNPKTPLGGRYCPSWPHISQDSLHTQIRIKREREYGNIT